MASPLVLAAKKHPGTLHQAKFNLERYVVQWARWNANSKGRPVMAVGMKEVLKTKAYKSSDSTAEDDEITVLLVAWENGDSAALGTLMETVYDQLRRIAGGALRGERFGHTLQTTALVHETFLRLAKNDRIQWQNRSQFFAIASKIMRRILVDHARSHRCSRRGGGSLIRENSEILDQLVLERPSEVIALDDALTALADLDAEQSQVVELRYFGGMTKEQVAEALGMSRATVARRWRLARIWLFRELSERADGS